MTIIEQDSLYHHPVHKISFIAQDMTDSRAFGYIFGSPDTGHRFFGIKTDKAASQVSGTIDYINFKNLIYTTPKTDPDAKEIGTLWIRIMILTMIVDEKKPNCPTLKPIWSWERKAYNNNIYFSKTKTYKSYIERTLKYEIRVFVRDWRLY